jgi:putative aldouronate transport system permease protein
MIRPVIAIQIILAVGNMMKTDIGMFQQVTMDQALLYPATDVVDTFVYRSLIKLRDVGMSSAAAFFQSAVGCLLLLAANFAVGKVDPDSSLF